MEQLYEQDLKINRKRLNELKAENKSEEICRMEDSYFKFILKERVLDGVGRELIRMYFGDNSVSGLSSGSEEIQVEYGKRTFAMDVFARSREYDVDIEMQNTSYHIDRFLIYWGGWSANKDPGTDTRKLVLEKKCLTVIISSVGAPNNLRPPSENWYWGAGYCSFDLVNRNIIGELFQKGPCTLIIDLNRFREKVKKPSSFLEYYLSYLLCSTYEDLESLCDNDDRGIMEDIVARDLRFLTGTDTWRGYMENYNKFWTARFEQALPEWKARIRAETEACIRAETEACIRAETEARVRAETEARVRAETEARVRAETEARVRTETEARVRAETEARVRTETEARVRAETEARVRAELDEYRNKLERADEENAEKEKRLRIMEARILELSSASAKKNI